MSALLPLLITAPIAVGSVAYYLLTNPRRRLRREIKRVPSTTIANAETGLVRISGTIVAYGEDELMESPLSLHRCVAWRFSVDRRRARGGDRKEWVTVVNNAQNVPFLIRDETGTALVKGAKLDFTTRSAERGRTWPWVRPSPKVCQALQRSGLVPNEQSRFRQRILKVGMHVSVVGHGHWERSTADGYRGLGRRLLITANEDGRVLACD